MAYPVLAPNCTWYKGAAKRATITQINIVDSYTTTGSENESWNADVSNTGSIKCYRTGTVLTIAGNGSGKIAMNTDSSWIFSHSSKTDYFSKLTIINGAEILDSTSVTSLSRAFQYCTALVSIDVSTWNTSNVTNMAAMCQRCQSLITFDVSNWNTENVIDVRGIFNCCYVLPTLDVSNWSTSKFTSLYLAFQQCNALTTLDVSKWDVSNVTDMENTFKGCCSLKELDVSKWNTSNVTTMNSMFSSGGDYGEKGLTLKTLDVSNWDVSNVTDMGWTFYGMNVPSGSSEYKRKLNLSKWNPKKVTSFHHFTAHSYIDFEDGVADWDVSSCKSFCAMFHTCKSEELDLSKWDVSSGESFEMMFKYSGLQKIKGLENWDTSNGKTFEEMFCSCPNLVELDLSNFDTRNATYDWIDPIREEQGMIIHGNMSRMFGVDTNKHWSMKKISLGENFSFDGSGSVTINAVLPTPNEAKIPGADGKWYTLDGTAYAPADIPNRTAATYYASIDMMDINYLADHPTLLRLASVVRSITDNTKQMKLGEMKEELDVLSTEAQIQSDLIVEIQDTLKFKAGGGQADELYNEGIEVGKKNAYDEFWDSYQQNGALRYYQYAFSGHGWNDTTFRPKYDIVTGTSQNHYYVFSNSKITNLKQILLDCNVKLDVSEGGYFTSMFGDSTITDVGELDLRKAGTILILSGAKCLKNVDKFILNPAGTSNVFTASSFSGCTALEHIIFEGIINQNISFPVSNLLDNDSVQSIINALKPITDGTAKTLTFHQEVRDRLTEEQELTITGTAEQGGKGWTLLPARTVSE